MQSIKDIESTCLEENDVVRAYCKKCDKNTLFRIVAINEDIIGMCGKCRDYKTLRKTYDYTSQVMQNIPQCPTCHSTNLKKISTTSKAVNTVMFGFLGTKRYKTFRCNNCGYEW